MVWKKVANSDAGDTDHFGGDDLDKVSDLLSGVDVDDVDMASDWSFRDQKLQFMNPAGTFKLTQVNPAITANAEYRFNSPYNYFIFKSGTTYYAKSGITKAVEYSGSVADVVIQNVITSAMSSSRGGGIIQFSKDDFPFTTPILIPTSTTLKSIFIRGHPSVIRSQGTVFSATTAFPDGRYMFETDAATNGSGKQVALHIKDIGCYNLNATGLGSTDTDVGFLKYELDNHPERTLFLDNIYTQYMWRGIHLIGGVWWPVIRNCSFTDANSSFVGDADIIMEQGGHTGSGNQWPKYGIIENSLSLHAGTMVNSLRIVDGSYNMFTNYNIEGNDYSGAGFTLTGQANFNRFTNLDVLDSTGTGAFPTLLLSGTDCYDNKFIGCKLISLGTGTPYALGIKSGAFRNDIELAAYWGNAAAIDDSGSGIDNVVRIFPGARLAASPAAKVVTTGGAGNLRVIDNRKGAATRGTASKNGDATTKAFTIAHGCMTTPGYFAVWPTSAEARGNIVLTADATNITVTYPTAPATGTGNLTYVWNAEVTY